MSFSTTPGSRVVAVLKSDETTIYLLGHGVFAGTFHKPGQKPFDVAYVRALLTATDLPMAPDDMDEMTMTEEQFQAHADAINTSPFVLNPRIDLDGGGVAWGFECWWGSEAGFEATIRGRKIIEVEAVRNEEGILTGYRQKAGANLAAPTSRACPMGPSNQAPRPITPEP